MPKWEDLTGRVYGYLTVIEQAPGRDDHRTYWRCVCKCGNETIVPTYRLKDGSTKSCGCKKFETHNATHAMRHTRIYETWCGIKKRCYNQNSKSYPNYGGRGITMCDEWKDDFMAFYNWAMSTGYTDDLTIDRIDVNGNYEPGNCKWSTRLEQQRNRTTTIFLERNGETKTLVEWCKILGVDYESARLKHKRAKTEKGFATFDDVFFAPTIHWSKKIAQYTKDGEFIRYWNGGATEAARVGGFSRTSIQQCLSGKVKLSGGYAWKYAEA